MMHARTVATALALALAVPAPGSAQAGAPSGDRPEGWRILTDEIGADTASMTFVAMDPGFHVTTGPAAIFYDPTVTGRGTFRAEASIHLFEPGDGNESFGVFVGGSDLDGSYQAYTSFMIRKTGEYSVGRRISFTSTETVVAWTPHEAIVAWEDREEGEATVENTLAVEARENELVFFVNGQEVDRVVRSRDAVDGIVGLRINPGLDLHVTEFEVAPL